MTPRCEARNEDGARCLYLNHDSDRHMFPGDVGRDSYDLGKLQGAVRAFLYREIGQGFLVRTLAETEEGRA